MEEVVIEWMMWLYSSHGLFSLINVQFGKDQSHSRPLNYLYICHLYCFRCVTEFMTRFVLAQKYELLILRYQCQSRVRFCLSSRLCCLAHVSDVHSKLLLIDFASAIPRSQIIRGSESPWGASIHPCP
jgi:hypothetical protein